MSLLVFSLLGCGAGSSSSGGATTPLPTTPAVLSISPSPLAANGGAPIQITLTGSGFVSASQVEVNGAAVSTTFLSATNLQATLPAAVLASGSQLSITVVNGTGPGSAAIILTVANPAPLVSALSPSAVPLGSATMVLTLTGSGFVPSTTLTLNGVAHAVSYTNGTQLALTLSAADVSAAGTETVVAVNPAPGGGSSPPFTFAVTNPPPVVTTLSPASATVGAGPVTLSVAGSGFLPTTTLTFNGAAHAATYVSGTLLNVTLSPADLLTAGNASVVVANPAPGGGSSAAVALPVVNPAPVLSTITPASASVGAVAFTLDLEGSSFTAASVVLWNGTALPTTFLSTTELKAQVGAGQLSAVGSATVAVSTPVPGGGVSNAVSFTITVGVPVLTGISPHTVPQNGAAVINLVGSGFTGASVVNWNGSPRPTTFLSATSLQVNLSAQDLSAAGTGQLTVATPSPGGGLSAPQPLVITNLPIPTVSNVAFFKIANGGCSQIQFVLTGTNFYGGGLTTLQVNGQALAANAGPPTLLEGLLPPNFSAANVVFTVTTNLGGAISSEPYTVPSSIPPILALCALPTSASLLPGSSFLMGFQASSINVSGSPSLTSLTLPAGITTQATLPVALPSAGVRLLLQAGSSIAGTVSIPFTGGAAAASTNGTATFTVSTVAPSISLQSPLFDELAVPLGGQGSLTFGSQNYPYLDIAVNLAVSGLPAGATATVSPSTILPGDSFTVTVHAAANAPVSQNTKVIVTATPSSASAQPYTASFLLDITQSPGSLLNSRSDFVSTAATPLAAVYNRALDVIYASNPTWNRIDILSNRTRTLLQSISLRGPAGIDLSPDGGTLWIGTQSQQIFAMNTTTLALTRYLAPAVANFSSWQDVTLFALADGTLALSVTNEPGSGEISDILWNPNTNTTQTLSLQAQLEMRSGDHTKVYGNYINSVSCPIDMYDTVSGQTRILTGLTERCSLGAISPDGSRIVAENNGIYGLYDGSLNFLGALSMTLTNFSLAIDGGWLFSADGSTLYQVGTPSSGTPTYILTYNVGTRSLSGTAPALAASGAGPGGSSAPGALVDVDNSGILLAIQTFGISFQDSTFFQSYPNTPPGENVGIGLTSTLEGPLAGGTTSSIFGVSSELPDVWYGPNRGTASLDGSNDLTIVSPPGNAGGPVNLKFIYPNGNQLFLPEGFTYGPSLEYATLSGASPSGGVAGTAAGFGLPASPDGGTVTVGGRPAVITTEPGQYAPSTGEPFPSTFLNFTIPAGTPGYADLNVTTPTGTSTLPKAMFYAKSVNDYPSQDTFTDVLYDEARQQVYLAAGDHIDVFSMGSNQFVSPLRPASLGAASSFRGLALTTDGTELLAANMADGSLGVIHPDAPSQTFAIPIAAATGTGTTCARGPFAVTALAGNRAFVSAGLPPLVGGCPFNNTLSLVNLQTRSASAINTCGVFNNGYASALESTADGMHAILGTSGEGTCVYSTATNTFTSGPTAVFSYYGATISSDGNIAADGNAFLDLAGNALGNIGHPAVFYNTTGLFTTTTYPGDILQRPRLNGSGSLYYWAYPSYFEIIDVPTGTLRLRFSLAETVQNVETPLATDAAGQHVFLITSAGLTVVDLGTAPLSIGHFAPSNGARGTVIQVRGSGFEAGITATIGGQPATVTMIDQSTLSVAMPNTPSGPQSLTLTNPDGTTYTAPSAILAP